MWELMNNISSFFGVISAVFALFAWLSAYKISKEQKRQKQMLETPVQIVLTSEGKELVLPYSPMRQELSRGEVLGVLGMFSQGRRYDLPELGKVFYKGEYNKVIKGESNKLTILVPPKEFELFSAYCKAEK